MREGWDLVKLGSLCDIQNGFAFDSKLFNNDGKGLPLIRIRDIKRGYSETFTTEECDNAYVVKDGDYLIGMDGEFNIGQWKSENALLNQRVCKLLPSSKILPRFIYYYIPKALKDIEDKTAYATVKHLSSKQIKEINIPNISLPEQQRIVDILDREFAKIDALKANAEKSLQAAKDLFQATLKKELEPKAGWHNTSLHSICKSLFAGGDAPKGKISKIKTEEYSIPILSNGIGENAIYGYTTDARVFDKAITISARGTIGYVALRESPFFPIVRLIVAIPGDDVLAEYLKHYLTTISFRSDGTAIPQLTIPMIKDFVVTYPSKEKQRSIVSLLNDLNDRCKSLQDNYQKTRTFCDDLKQSLLRKAFIGEL